MKMVVTMGTFIREIQHRHIHRFTRHGLVALYKYLEQQEADQGEEILFDPDAMADNWREFRSTVKALYAFDADRADQINEDAKGDYAKAEAAGLEALRDVTEVIKTDAFVFVKV